MLLLLSLLSLSLLSLSLSLLSPCPSDASRKPNLRGRETDLEPGHSAMDADDEDEINTLELLCVYIIGMLLLRLLSLLSLLLLPNCHCLVLVLFGVCRSVRILRFLGIDDDDGPPPPDL